MQTPTPSCPRCRAALDHEPCKTCGYTGDAAEALRQDRYLVHVVDGILRQKLSAPAALAALARTKSAAEARVVAAHEEAQRAAEAEAAEAHRQLALPLLLDAGGGGTGPAAERPGDGAATITAPATATTTAGASATATAATTATTRATTTAATTPAARTPAPPRAAIAPRRSPPPPRAPVDPAVAKAQLQQRLELGVWFVGALFAVGGSLWATNLFWGDIPVAVRPGVVGGGLALFASAFMAVGAILGRRFVDNVAGKVLGLVGRLIAVSSAIPFATLRPERPLLAVVFGGVALAVLAGALSFTRSRSAPSASDSDERAPGPGRPRAWWRRLATPHASFLLGWALLIVAPRGELFGLLVALACVGLLRVSISARTDHALAGRSTFVDDVSAVLVGVTGMIMALGFSVDDVAVDGVRECFVVMLAVDTLGRVFDQRPRLFGAAGFFRWLTFLSEIVLGLVVFGCAADAARSHALAFLYAALAALVVAARLWRHENLGLPRGARPFASALAAVAVGFLLRALSVHDAWCALAASLALFVFTWRSGALGRGRPVDARTFGEKFNLVLVLFAFFIGAAAAGDGHWRAAPALAVLAVVVAVDRRSERSVLWALFAWGAGLLPLVALGDLDWLQRGDVVALLCASYLALGLVACVALRVVKPAWPLIPASTAAFAWTSLFALVAASAVFASGRHLQVLPSLDDVGAHADLVLVVALAAAAAMLVAAEVPRSSDLSLIALVPFVLVGARAYAGHDDQGLVLGLALCGAACAALAFLPSLPFAAFAPTLRHPRLLRRLHVLGRGRRGRALAAFWLSAALVAVVVVLRAALMLDDGGLDARPDAHAVAAVAAAAAVLLFVRARSARALAGTLAVLVVSAGELRFALAPLFDALYGERFRAPGADAAWSVAAAGLCSLAAALVAALGLNALRMARTTLPRVTRLVRRARHPRVDAGALAWPVLLVLAGVVVSLGVLDRMALVADVTAVSEAAQLLFETALFLGLASLTALAFFASRAKSPLVAAAVIGVMLALDVATCAAALSGHDQLTLALGLAQIAALIAVLALARRMYRRSAPPRVLAGLPSSGALRAPAWVMAAAFAVALSTVAAVLAFFAGDSDMDKYRVGVMIVAVAVFPLAWATLHFRRTVPAAVLAGALAGLAGSSLDWLSHALKWLPPSHGASQANGALLLVAVAYALQAAWGRRIFVALGLGLPKKARGTIAVVIEVVVIILAFVGFLAAGAQAPRLSPEPVIAGGLALAALGFVRRNNATAPLAAFGAAVAAAGVAAVFAPRLLDASAPLDVDAWPLLCLAALIACALVQRFGDRVFAKASRQAAEGLAFFLLLVVVALTAVIAHPSGLQLACTWASLALAVVVFARSAMRRDQDTGTVGGTFLAALAQGAALAIYVDLRRRTPWLDDVDGVDALACLVGAVGFLALRAFLPKRSPLARAAELYASTLPVIAALLGPSQAARAVILVVGGGVYALLARTRKLARYELLAGGMILIATEIALSLQGASDPALYLLPAAFTATFLARRHRAKLGNIGRVLAVLSHVPLYCTAAWSALSTATFSSFALGILVVSGGVVYSLWVKDRRSLYAAAAAAFVLVGGRLILAGLDNAVLGTLLLVGCGIALLAGMTIFTIRRDLATGALKKASSALDDWR